MSPSDKELRHLGQSKAEQSQALKAYIRQELLPAYAANFNKGLGASDMLYYAKVHHEACWTVRAGVRPADGL